MNAGKREIEQYLIELQNTKIIDGFAPVCKAEPTRYYVMIYAKLADYKKDYARNIVGRISGRFSNLDIGVGTISKT